MSTENNKTFEDHYYESERLNIEARKELTQVKVKLSIAMRMVEKLEKSNAFYADPEKWMRKDRDGWSKNSPRSHGDEELIMRYHHPKTDWVGTIDVGGKLARQAIKEVEELKKGLR